MDIHEYQAKEILKSFGVTVPDGALAYSPEQAAYRARELGGNKWVVKAQVHAGGRGKAGGVKLCSTDHEILDVCSDMFGMKLVTHQTGPEGKGVYRVYVEAATPFNREIYLGFVLDRTSQRIMIVASAEGGMEIEDISATRPESIVRSTVEPAVGLRDFQAREIAFALGIPADLTQQMVRTLQGCYRAFTDLDATMVEINPLVITADNRIMALDAKMTFDSNALFRHPQISELRDKSQEDPRESRAADRGLAYIGLSGNIGCIVNGAGPCHGDDGHDQAGRGRARELPRHRRRRHARTRGESLPPRDLGQECAGHPGEHLRRHQPLRLGGRRRRPGAEGRTRGRARHRAPGRHQCRGRPEDPCRIGPAHHPRRIADGSGNQRAVTAWKNDTAQNTKLRATK